MNIIKYPSTESSTDDAVLHAQNKYLENTLYYLSLNFSGQFISFEQQQLEKQREEDYVRP
jgi:hypothetical protein